MAARRHTPAVPLKPKKPHVLEPTCTIKKLLLQRLLWSSQAFADRAPQDKQFLISQ
jgi:hypothetical protein